MTEARPPRPYRSPLRDDAARRTRAAVLAAARELFVTQGYGATSVDAIAARAGVSKPTVFAAVGNKATLLKVVRDVAMAGDDDPVPVLQRPAYRELLAEPDPYRTVRLLARNTVALLSRYAAVDEVVRGAADADHELRELWASSEAQRLAAARAYVDNLLGKGPLAPGLEPGPAADLVWLLIAPTNYHRLVVGRGWTHERFEDWLATALTAHLLPVRQPAKETNP